MKQLTFEGLDVGSLRATVQAVHVVIDEPLRVGDRVRFTGEAIVEELRFPRGETGIEYRTHILKPERIEILTSSPKSEDAA